MLVQYQRINVSFKHKHLCLALTLITSKCLHIDMPAGDRYPMAAFNNSGFSINPNCADSLDSLHFRISLSSISSHTEDLQSYLCLMNPPIHLLFLLKTTFIRPGGP